MVKKKKIAVIGIGNLIMRDDGVGIHTVRALRELRFADNIDLNIIDGGLEPDITVLLDEGVDKLIMVDAVQAGGKPGDIYRLTITDVENSGYQIRSAHYLNMKQTLEMMKLTGVLPAEIVVIGVEPAEMTQGLELSSAIGAKFPEVVAIVTKEITDI